MHIFIFTIVQIYFFATILQEHKNTKKLRFLKGDINTATIVNLVLIANAVTVTIVFLIILTVVIQFVITIKTNRTIQKENTELCKKINFLFFFLIFNFKKRKKKKLNFDLKGVKAQCDFVQYVYCTFIQESGTVFIAFK